VTADSADRVARAMPTEVRRRGNSWEAFVWLPREKRKMRKTFPTLAAAKSWRADATALAARGGLRAPKPTTVREAWETWHEGARTGMIRNRSGDPYKPSTLRSYAGAMRRHVLPELGAVRLTDLSRPDLQDFTDGLLAAGFSPSTIQVALLPMRAIFRRPSTRRAGGEPVYWPRTSRRPGAA
jgi:integrase